MRRRLSGFHVGRRTCTAAVVALALAAGALGFFTHTGIGTATAAVGAINPPSTVTAARSGVNVAISWNAATLSSGGAVQGYYVKRSDGATICGVPTLVTGVSCTDATVTPGTFTYTATAVYHLLTASATSNSITITLTAPTLTSTPSNPSANTSPGFSVTGGGGSAYQCQIDGGSFTSCTSPKSYSGLTGGSHTFKVHATLNGSTGPDTTYPWTIDTSAPSMTAEPSNPSGNSSPSFSFSHTQATYTFKCQLDGSGFPACTSPKSYSGLSDGSHTFQVEGVSADGAITVAASYTWLIDTIAPTSAITFPASGGNYNHTGWNAGCTSAICGTASDSGSGVQKVLVSIQQGAANYWNGTSFASASEQKLTATGATSWTLAFAATNFLSDGTYTVRTYGVDNAGNTQSVATTATFTIDSTGPTVTLTQVNGGAVTFPFTTSTSAVTSIGGACGTSSGDSSTVSWSVTGSANESGTATCLSGAWNATLSPPLGAAGTFTVAATQADAAGNIGSSGNKSITINATTLPETAAGPYTLTVPAHVTSVSFTLKGAGGGGGSSGGVGAAGGSSSGTFSVPDSSSSTTFSVVVGGGGHGGGVGGSGGTFCAAGGAGGGGGLLGGPGGGGGGATCIYRTGALSGLIAVAAGGGGGGGGGSAAGGGGGGGASANPGTDIGGAGGSTNGGGGGTATTSGSFPFSLSLIFGAGGGNGTNGGTCSSGTCGAGGSGGGVLLLAGAGGGGGGGVASGGGGGGALALAPGGGGGGGGGYDGGAANFPVTVTSASNGGGSAGGGANTTGTAGSVSFTGVAITLA